MELIKQTETLQKKSIKATKWSDERIIQEIQTGDRELFFTLVERYETRLFKLATVITGNTADAEDALQEGFIAAYNYLGHFQGKSSFYTWIYRIVINKSKDIRAKRIKTNHNSIEEYDLDFFDQRLNIPNDIEKSELYNFLLQKVDSLSEIYREILILRFFEELSYQEIAQVLKIREGTVKSRLFKAKEQLREIILQDKQGGELIHDLV